MVIYFLLPFMFNIPTADMVAVSLFRVSYFVMLFVFPSPTCTIYFMCSFRALYKHIYVHYMVYLARHDLLLFLDMMCF